MEWREAANFCFEGEAVELGRGVEAVAADQDAALAEEVGGGKPDGTAAGGEELEAAVDVVVLLPEAAALPGDFVGAGVGALVDDFLVGRAEVVGRLLRMVSGMAQKQKSASMDLGWPCWV